MARDTLQRAADRAERLLLSRPVLESLLARRDLHGGGALSREFVELLARELCHAREPDGSWQLSACRTAEHLLLLRELDRDGALLPFAAPGIEWLLHRLPTSRQNGSTEPCGSVTLCTPLMHELGVCVHAAPDLLLVVPARIELGGLRLANGAAFMSDIDARVAVCALSVAALLAWGVDPTALRAHLDALRRVAMLEDEQRISLLSTNGLACVVRALLASLSVSDDERTRAALASACRVLARAQRADGTWPTGHLFYVLSVVIEAAAEPRLAGALDRALRRSAQQLALLQQPDGGWSRGGGTWSLLVGWRVLRAAAAAAGPAHTPPPRAEAAVAAPVMAVR
jgi:hypothetical protein